MLLEAFTYKEAITIIPLNPDFTKDDLKKEYRALALKNHPDRINGDLEQMKNINLAYEALQPYARLVPIRQKKIVPLIGLEELLGPLFYDYKNDNHYY